ATLGAVHFAAQVVVCLVPATITQLMTPPIWMVVVYVVDDWSLLLAAPVAWHLIHYWGAHVDPPGPVRKAFCYGSATLVMALTLVFPIVLRGFANPLIAYFMIRNTYMVVVFGLAVRRMMRVARRGRWRPGAAGNAVLGADIWLFGGGIAVMVVVLALLAFGGLPVRVSLRGFLIDAAITILVTIPIAVRELTHVVRALLFTGGVLA